MKNNKHFFLPENYISLILQDTIYLENVSENVVDAIQKINAYKDDTNGRSTWKVFYSSQLELVEKISELNALGFLFAGGPAGWPPAEVFDYLRKKIF